MAATSLINLLSPATPTTPLALTAASATLTLGTFKEAGWAVMLFNKSGATAYCAFDGTAAVATGFPLAAGEGSGPLAIPYGTTQLSAILESGTGSLLVTIGQVKR